MHERFGKELMLKKLKGVNGLSSLDPFNDKISLDERQYCLEKYKADSKHEWEDDVGYIFERLNDESSDDEL